MPIARVQSGHNENTASGTTIATGTISGIAADSLVVVLVSVEDGVTVSSVKDDLNVSAMKAEGVDWVAGTQRGELWYFKNYGGGNRNFTATFSATQPFRAILAIEYSGADVDAPLIGVCHATGSSAAPSSGTPVTPGMDGALYVGSAIGASQPAAASPFTVVLNDTTTVINTEDYVQPTAAPRDAIWTMTSGGWGALVALFRPAPSGGFSRWQREDGGFWLREDGGFRLREESSSGSDFSGTAVVTGGGVVTLAATGAHAEAAAVHGGGIVTVADRKNAFRALAISGGGAATVVGSEGESRQVVVTGGGTVVATERTARSSAPQVHGGGTLAVVGGQAESRSGVVTLHGGGTVVVSGTNSTPALDDGGSGLRFRSRVSTTPPTIRRARGDARVTARGDLRTRGGKIVRARAQVLGGGTTVVHGTKDYPMRLRQATEIAIAA